MAVVELIAAAEIGWTGIVVAALGSSALGAIVGGYVTTRMRGRVEREEAWRTRLIEAADDLNGVLVQALTTLGGLLPLAASGYQPLRTKSGALTSAAAAVLDSAHELLGQAGVRLSRVELLFSVESDVQQHGFRTMHLLQRAVGLARGRPNAQLLVQAVLDARGRQDAEWWETVAAPQDIANVEILRVRQALPDDFDPSDDVNVARWARELHHAAGDSAHEYMRAAHASIEGYRLGD